MTPPRRSAVSTSTTCGYVRPTTQLAIPNGRRSCSRRANNTPEWICPQVRETMMAVKKKGTVHTPQLESYEKLTATNPGVERKGATHPYTSLNGHMFSCLHPSGAM